MWTGDPLTHSDETILTAYHEAAHAVTAHLSSFHSPIGRIGLLSSSTGEAHVALSSAKLKKNGKWVGTNSEKDREVRVDFALIILSGLAAETFLVSCGGHGGRVLRSNPANAADDLAFAESLVGPANVSTISNRALEIVEMHWRSIHSVAAALLRNGHLDATEVIEIVDSVIRTAP